MRSGRQPGEGQVAPALADDLVAGREPDEVGESLDRDRVAVADELGDRVAHGRDLGPFRHPLMMTGERPRLRRPTAVAMKPRNPPHCCVPLDAHLFGWRTGRRRSLASHRAEPAMTRIVRRLYTCMRAVPDHDCRSASSRARPLRRPINQLLTHVHSALSVVDARARRSSSGCRRRWSSSGWQPHLVSTPSTTRSVGGGSPRWRPG